jgi:hypothetical protein
MVQVPKQGNAADARRRPRVKARRSLLNDKLGLQRSPLPEIFTGLVGDPIADIGCRLKVTDASVGAFGQRASAYHVPSLRCLGFRIGPE